MNPRLVKGTASIDIVKIVRHVRKERRYPPLRGDGAALLEQRILPTEWYPLDAFLVLIRFAFDELLGGSEQKALDMGAAGGGAQLAGPHKAFLDEQNALNSAWAMRHMWRLNFNFGEMRAERDEHSVSYVLSGYPDVPPAHAFMVVGWTLAGVRKTGTQSKVEILERPWHDGEALRWRVSIPGG